VCEWGDVIGGGDKGRTFKNVGISIQSGGQLVRSRSYRKTVGHDEGGTHLCGGKGFCLDEPQKESLTLRGDSEKVRT